MKSILSCRVDITKVPQMFPMKKYKFGFESQVKQLAYNSFSFN